MHPESTTPAPDRLTLRAAQAVHNDLHTVLESLLLPFESESALRRLAAVPPPETLPGLTGLLPLPDDTPGPFVEASVRPHDATSANVEVRCFLGRLHVRRFRAQSFLLANTHDTDLKVWAPDGGRQNPDLWVSWQRNQAVGDGANLAKLLALAAARAVVLHCLLRQHFPGLIPGARLAEWAAAAARAHHADRDETDDGMEEGRVWHLAAQNPGAFLAAMTEQAAAAGDSLPPAVRLQLHLWRQDFAGALAAVEELCEPPAPADPTGELGCLRAGLHERAGQAASALVLLEPLTAHAGQRHRVAGIRMRALLALGRAREVLAAVEAGGFGAPEATCWPHWWRAQAWHQLGDEAAAAAALAAHEDFFGTDLEARRSLGEGIRDARSSVNPRGR